MRISENGLDIVKQFEGLVLTAYQDAVGVWTIGYGHTKGVRKGQKITEKEAEELLQQDMRSSEKAVEKYNSVYNWNQNEFDALVSFAFNIGSIDQLTNKGKRSKKEIADKMLLYYNAGGKKLEILEVRRRKERALFLTPVGGTPKEDITPAEVNKFVLDAAGTIYVWGANFDPITKDNCRKWLETYGSSTYNSSYYNKKLKEGNGKIGADCSGFFFPLSKVDRTAQGYYNNCVEKGRINTLPDGVPCLIFKENAKGIYHIGWSLGDGTEVDMRSSSANYKHQKISGGGWTHWGIPSWVNYSDSQKAEWIKKGDNWLYRKADGKLAVNEWIEDGSQYYVFDGSGNMIRGWFMQDRETWYYMNPANGAMLSNQWTDEIDGKFYFLTESGIMARNAFVKSRTEAELYHFVGPDGEWIPENDIRVYDLKVYN